MQSYNKRDLDILTKDTAFLRDNLEKVVRLVDILEFFNNDDLLSHKLALKGGTAINLIVFEMPRLSVDIDLDFTEDCSRDEMLNTRTLINERISTFMTTNGYVINPNTKTPHSLDSWVFSYVNAGGNHDNIKIEINYSMRVHVMPLEKYNVNIPFLKRITIRSLSMTELFGSKIKALIERNACRDLYDVNNMITHDLQLDKNLLRKIVLFYLAVGGSQKLQMEYSLENVNEIQFKQIRASLIPVLKKTENFDFATAKIRVKDYVSELLQFSENEKSFIEDFNKRNYQPQLLFENDEIIQRIANHPMALWKCGIKA